MSSASPKRWCGCAQDDGTLIHLDIEPEPDCSLENTDETLEFFEQRLLPIGAPLLARALGSRPPTTARDHLLEHIRICFDCCHFAVEFEDAAHALERIRGAGIKIGRVQLSSALDVAVPGDPDETARLVERLRPFADATYLHQVVERRGGELRHYLDLPDALERAGEPGAAALADSLPRAAVHRRLRRLGSTQAYVADVLQPHARDRRDHPPRDRNLHLGRAAGGLKLDLLESIGREYEWVLRHGARSPKPTATQTSYQRCTRPSSSTSSA